MELTDVGQTTCAEDGCDVQIDGSPPHRCGYLEAFEGWPGCGKYFCYTHLNSWSQCATCADLVEDPYEDSIE